MKKTGIILILAGLMILFAAARVETARGWEEDKLAVLRYTHMPGTDLDQEEGKIEMNGIYGMAMFPFVVNDQVVLFPGLAYHGLFLEYKDLTFSYPLPDGGAFTEKDLPADLHILDVILGGNIQWEKNLGTALILYPGIHSDFEDLEGDDIYFSGAALLSYRVSEGLLFSGGLYSLNLR